MLCLTCVHHQRAFVTLVSCSILNCHWNNTSQNVHPAAFCMFYIFDNSIVESAVIFQFVWYWLLLHQDWTTVVLFLQVCLATPFVLCNVFRTQPCIWSSISSHATTSYRASFNYTLATDIIPHQLQALCINVCNSQLTVSVYMVSLISTASYQSSRYHFQSSKSLDYINPRLHSKLSKWAFFFAWPAAWNVLSTLIHSQSILTGFKRALKTHLFQTAVNIHV